MSDVLQFLITNKDVLITFVISLIAVVKLTAWGKAQAAALDAVVGVIEQIGGRSVKLGVASSMGELPDAAQDAIADSVAKADPKKTQPSLLIRIAREVFRF